VVHTADQCAAGAVRIDQVELPQRPRKVEGRAEQRTDDLLQGGLIAWRRQQSPLQVVPQVKARIVFPGGLARSGLDSALPKKGQGQQALFERCPKPLERDDRAKDQEGRDRHRVGRVLQAQPGSVGVGQ
jgi:hypothetical protein